MCKAIEDMINESKAEGRAEGKAEGRAEGEAIGFEKALANLIKNGMEEQQARKMLEMPLQSNT